METNNMNIRERFEEIWPVPAGIVWIPHCGYAPDIGVDADSVLDDCVELDLRLDTFTRCQESMYPVLSLINELVADLQYRVLYNAIEDDNERSQVRINQIKKILGA